MCSPSCSPPGMKTWRMLSSGIGLNLITLAVRTMISIIMITLIRFHDDPRNKKEDQTINNDMTKISKVSVIAASTYGCPLLGMHDFPAWANTTDCSSIMQWNQKTASFSFSEFFRSASLQVDLPAKLNNFRAELLLHSRPVMFTKKNLGKKPTKTSNRKFFSFVMCRLNDICARVFFNTFCNPQRTCTDNNCK